MPRERLDAAKRDRAPAAERVELPETADRPGARSIINESIDRLSGALRQALQSDDPSFRKAYVRLFVDQVVVGNDEIRIRGPSSHWLGQRRRGFDDRRTDAQFCSRMASRTRFELVLPP
jgi:hypothetical protein